MSDPSARIRRAAMTVVVVLGGLTTAPSAWAHSSITPGVTEAKLLQQFTLDIQAEKEDTTTTRIELTVPDGFTVETFAAVPGWKRRVVASGSGEEANVQRVVWTGTAGSPREDPVFHFTGTPESPGSYGFKVRQIYADGSVTDWVGAEGAEHPAAFVTAVASLGDGSSSTLAIIALAVGGAGVLLGLIGILAGRRSLT